MAKVKWRLNQQERDALPRSLKGHYRRGEDGETWILEVEDDDGGLVVPPPISTEPPEDVGPLKRAFEAAKAERDDTRKQLRDVRAALASDDATTAFRATLEARQEELTAREATNQAEYERARDALKAEWEPKIAERVGKLQAVLAQGDEAVLENTLINTIRDARGIVTFLEPKMRKFCKVVCDEDGNRTVVVHDDDGNIRVGVTPQQALEELKIFDPLLRRMAFDDGGNGNGAPH